MIKQAAAIVIMCSGAVASAGLVESFSDPMPGVGDPVTLEQAGDLYTLHIDDGETIAVDDISIQGDRFNGSNTHFASITLAPGQQAIAIGWNISLTAPSPSVLSDLRIAVTNSSGEGVVLTPFEGISFPGTYYQTSGGLITLDTLGFALNPDGELHFLFYTDFDTVLGQDMLIDTGSITVQLIPTPGAGAIAGLGLTLLRPRRR